MLCHVLTVEERLRSSRTICNAVRQICFLADEARSVAVPGFTPEAVVTQIPETLDVLAAQIDAIEAALPPRSLNIAAPAGAVRRATDAKRKRARLPVRLSDVVRMILGREDAREIRALSLAEQQAESMLAQDELMWLVDRGVDTPVPEAVAALTARLGRADRSNSYRNAKLGFEQFTGSPNGPLRPDEAVRMLEEIWLCETRAAYYLGLARGWLAALRMLESVR